MEVGIVEDRLGVLAILSSHVDDLSPLEAVPELRRLLIRGNNDTRQQRLRDTSALKKLKQLEVLELEFCPFIRDLSPLPKLPVLNHRPAQEVLKEWRRRLTNAGK